MAEPVGIFNPADLFCFYRARARRSVVRIMITLQVQINSNLISNLNINQLANNDAVCPSEAIGVKA
jgi:hypothetical protein